MTILIKGMEMPQKCGERCPFYDVDPNDGYPSCRARKYTGKPDSEAFHKVGVVFPEGCPLVEVPTPHGRLIDADALEVDTEWEAYQDGYTAYSRLQIDAAPTVIEAEEE